MGKNRIKIIFILVATAIITSAAYPQKNTDPVKINKNGRMLWRSNNREAFFWGVNYSSPFAHGFRQMGRYGSPGYPEPDVKTSSFADKYPKNSMYLIPEAIDAQERYKGYSF